MILTNKSVRRIRIFAGPNGSGKTTIVNAVKRAKKVRLGCYINADDIERKMRSSGKFLLNPLKFEIRNPSDFYEFAQNHGLVLNGKIKAISSIVKANKKSFVLLKPGLMSSYVSALIADFIREKLLSESKSFSFETVMSDERKLDLAKRAKAKGFRVYLYFVATVDPEINVRRVEQRVSLGGHPVDKRLIQKRYTGSLSLLYQMIKLTDRAYLFDNSGTQYELVAEITGGSKLEIKDPSKIPNWFYEYVYQKANAKKTK